MEDKDDNMKLIKERFASTGTIKPKKKRTDFSAHSKKINTGHSDKSVLKKYQTKQKMSFNMSKFAVKQTEKKCIQDLNIEEKSLYNTEDDKDCSILITKFLRVKDCSILKYGISQSTKKIKYSYCKTCDSSLIYPICIACIENCHKGHNVNKIIKLGNIKCSCGEKLHKIHNNIKRNSVYTNNIIKCLCNEWNKIAKLNIFYKTSDKKNICEFCNVICVDRKKIENSLDNSDFGRNKLNTLCFNMQETYSTNITECECNNLSMHNNKRKVIYGNIFFFCKYNSIYGKILHPLQIINMIFRSHGYFINNFSDFYEIFNQLKNPIKLKSIFDKYNNIEFTKTKEYLALSFFRKLAKKLSHKKLFYYCSEVKNFFNFENLKKLYNNSSINEKPFLIFMKEYLYLFNKIYINSETKSCNKYNIKDLENFSCIQRIILTKNNQKEFPEAEKIITFFLEWLSNIDNISTSYIESLSCIYQIVLIIYKFVTFNLVTNSNIVRFLLKIGKIFDVINYIRNCLIFNDNDNKEQKDQNEHNFTIYNTNTNISKENYDAINQIVNTDNKSKELSSNIEIKISYTTIKIIIYTLYNYNDKIIENSIFENKINIQKSLNKKNISFLFDQNELWPIILKMTILILSIIQNNYKIKNKKESKIYKIILRNSMTILEHSLCAHDIYYFSLVKSINDIKINYSNIIDYFDSELSSNIINDIINEKTNISISYNKFLNFEISKQELILTANNSLNKVLGDDKLSLLTTLYNEDFEPYSFSNEKNIGIIKAAYFLEISKILEILNNNINNTDNVKSFSIDNSQEKILEEYENISNSDNLLKISDIMKESNYKTIIDKIILFYFCFANKSSNNSLIILSRYILNELTKLPNDYGYLIFRLFHSCFFNIVSIDSIIINFKDIIKSLYKFLQKLIFSKDKNTSYCIFIFLKILKNLAYKIKIYHSNFINIIQKYILLLHNDYQFSFKYFELVQKEKTIEKELKINNNFPLSKISKLSKKKSRNNNKYISNLRNKKDEINKVKEEYDIKNNNNNKNILKDSFNIYIRLINDLFDFSIYNEREKVKKIININSIIYLLKNHNLNLKTRTEFLKYLRKMLVDLTYSENNKELYTKIIINDEDNLKGLKLNPLTNNSQYPTKYLSFIQDFYNISAKNIIQERQNLQYDIKENKIFSKENNINLTQKISIHSKNTSYDEENLSVEYVFSNRNSHSRSLSPSSRKDDSPNFENNLKNSSNYKSPFYFEKNSNLFNKNKKSLIREIHKSTISLMPEKDSSNEIITFGKITKKNLKTSFVNNNSELGKVELEIINQADAENVGSNEMSGDFYYSKEKTLKTEKIYNDSLNGLNDNKESINNTLKEDVNYSTPSNTVTESCVQETENKLNLLSCFDDLFYDILKYELENLTCFIEEELSFEKMDDEINKKILRNYLENGLLIPIIYFFKKSFSLIHNFSGQEMIKIYYLVEQSINLKLYISQLEYNLWDENDEENYEKESEIEESEENILKNGVLNNNRKPLIEGKYFKNKKLIEQTYKSLDAIKSKKISMFDYMSLYQIIEQEFFEILKDKRILSFNKIYESQKNNEIQKQIKQILNNYPKYQTENNLDISEKFYNIYLKYQYNKIFITEEKNSTLFNILSETSMIANTDYMNLLLKSLICCYINEDNNGEYHCKSFYLLYKLLSIKTPEIQLIITNSIKSDENNIVHQISNYLLEKIILLIIEYFNPVNEIKISNYFAVYTAVKFFKFLCQDNCFFKNYLTKDISYKYFDEMPFYFKVIPGITEIIPSFKNNKLLNNTNCIYTSLVVQPFIYYINFFDFLLLFSIKIIIISNWDELNNKNYTHQNSFLYKLFNALFELLIEIIRNNNYNFVLEDEISKDDSSKESSSNPQFKNKKPKIEENVCSLRIFFKYVSKILINKRNNLEILYKIKINIMEFILSFIEEKNNNENIRKEILKYLNVNQTIYIIIRILKNYYSNNINSTIKIENKYKDKINDKQSKYIMDTTPKRLQNNKVKKMINDNNMNVASTTTVYPLITTNKNFISVINSKLNKNGENNQQNTIASSSNTKFNNNSQAYELNTAYKKNLENISKLSKQKELAKNEPSSKCINSKSNSNNKLSNLKLGSIKNIKKYLELDFLEKSNEKYDALRKKQKIIFDNKLCDYFIKEFNDKKEFRRTNEFILSNALYKYAKIITVFSDNKIIKQFITKVNSNKENLSTDNKLQKDSLVLKRIKSNKIINKIIGTFYNKIVKQKDNNDEENNSYNDKAFIEKFYIVKFFESITSSIEVNLNDHSNQIIIFTKIPEMMYLSETTKKYFEHNANRESETNKKKDLMKNIKYFVAEIKYFEKHKLLNNFLRKFNFKIFNIISYIYGVVLNFILFILIKGGEFFIAPISNELRKSNKRYINKSIDSSLNEWKNTLYTLCYIYIILNGIIIIIWIYFRLPFLYKLDEIKYKEMHQLKTKIQLSDKLLIIIFMTFSNRDQILIIIYEFFLGILSLFIKRGEILYSLFLLPIVELNSTLKLIIKSINLRYKEFVLVGLLSSFVIYTLSNIAFFFFNSDYEAKLDSYDDNRCKSLISCFLNSIDDGLRARGGIGDSGKKISFLRNSKHYIGRLFLDCTFFLSIVIILTDMVFGIIVQSFSTLRHKEQLYLKDKYNRCFICNGKKSILEKHRINFQDHVKHEHNLWNYVEYIITIKQSNIKELNNINQYIRKKIENYDISWLPTNTDLFKKTEDFDYDEIVILEENTNKYKINKNDMKISANMSNKINHIEK